MNQKVNVTGHVVLRNKYPLINSILFRVRNRLKHSRIEKIVNKLRLKEPLTNFILFNRKGIIVNEKEKLHQDPPMNESTRRYLNRIYKEEIEKLEILLKRDLIFWK